VQRWKIAVIAFIALLSGCATASKIYLPDGRQGTLIKCSGWANSWGNCQEKAGELCGARGYDVVDRHEETVYIGVFQQAKPLRQMTVACKS
jgi:hypothetical protein